MSAAIVLLPVLAVLIVLSIVRRYRFASKLNQIPGFPTSLLGTGLRSAYALYNFKSGVRDSDDESILRFSHMFSHLFPAGIARFWFGPIPWVVITSPEYAELVLKNPQVIDKGYVYQFGKDLVGKGLLVSLKEKWQRHRKLLQPAFHNKLLESSLPIMTRNADILIEKIDLMSHGNAGIVERFQDLPLNCALDIICESAMGVKVNTQSDPNNQFATSIHNLFPIFNRRFWNPFLYNDRLYRLTSKFREAAEYLTCIRGFTRTVMKKRTSEIRAEETTTKPVDGKKSYQPFIDILIREHLKDPDNFTEVDVEDEVNTFMVAGFDTTAWSVTWAVYLLGLHPEVQQRMLTEITDSVYYETEPTTQSLNKLKYTDAVIKESMRLFEAIPLITRVTCDTLHLDGYEIPAGTQVALFLESIHRDPHHWLQPEKFDAERFLHRDSDRHPFSFLPFSAGIRNCIGQKFGTTEVKVIVIRILQKYKITSLTERDALRTGMAITVNTKVPIRVKFERRNIEN